MGINDLPSYEMYWKLKVNPFYNDFCGKLLTFERFSAIKKYFHVFDNEVYDQMETQSKKKVSKLDVLIEYFNNKFKAVYDPERELAVDENMCSWCGNGGCKLIYAIKTNKI